VTGFSGRASELRDLLSDIASDLLRDIASDVAVAEASLIPIE
jgi:hypothetical protein